MLIDKRQGWSKMELRKVTLVPFLLSVICSGALAQGADQGEADNSVAAPLMASPLGRADGASISGSGGNTFLGAPNAMPGTPANTQQPLPSRQGNPQDQPVNGTRQMQSLPPLPETLFQRFVREATGKPVELFGYKLFETARFPSVTDAPVPANYVLGPGDEIDLKVWGVIDFQSRLVIDRNGQVSVPKVGQITLAGIQSDKLESFLQARLSRVFANFQLSASVGRLRTIQVFVVGQARQPGAYVVSSLSTLVSALFQSGGPSAVGSMRSIQLMRSGKLIASVDLYRFITAGDTSSDVRLQPGDVVVVPPVGPRAAVVGALDVPAVFELKGQETLGQMLAHAGGVNALTALQKVQIEHLNPARAKGPRSVDLVPLDVTGLKTPIRDGDIVSLQKVMPDFSNAVTLRGNVAEPMRHAFVPGMRVADLIPDPQSLITRDYYHRHNRMVQFDPRPESGRDRSDNGAGTGQNLTPVLNNQGQLVWVDSSSRESREASQSREAGQSREGDGARDKAARKPDAAAVVQDMLMPLRSVPGNGVSAEAVRSSLSNLLDAINWDFAAIERLDAQAVKTRLIPFNLRKAIIDRDPAHNVELQPGDVVTIFNARDLPESVEKKTQFIRLAGEVKTPGIYELKPGETLSQLLDRAGGVSSYAFTYGTVFTRESTRKQQQENLARAVRQIEAYLNSSVVAAMQNLPGLADSAGASVNANALAQAQAASQIALLNRLKSSQPTGRMALDMDPVKPQWPDLVLEDGDQITIPARPSFVSLLGAVFAEASAIYKPNQSVKDYLDKAGLIEGADLDNVLVIRADGSIDGNGTSGASAWRSPVLSKKVYAGDTIFVPEKIDRRTAYNRFVQSAKDWTSILYQLGLGAAGIKVLSQ